MELRIDRSRCVGHGRCHALAPEVYDLDEEGYSVVRSETIEANLAEAARRGALSCPEQAITVEDADAGTEA